MGADRNTDGLAPDSPGFMVLEPGTTLRNGRYRLINRLGSGGMAAVWLAEDELLGRKVAVKLMSEVIAEEPAWLERFRREARVAAALSHPNLVDVYDFEPDAPRPYLVMAHVPAGTLAQRLEKDDVPEPRRLASELLAALAHMHANGVMHRDVKPSNVMLGADGAARLGDYGISRPRDAPAVTATGQVLGSARYMAPEVMSGEPSDERSDIYSCGVVLEEVLTGRPDPELAPLVERMTRDEPTERPDSARTLRRELERFEPSQPSVSDRTAPT
ncbi:MAG: serine/threonine protein kinase, partial [Solirubrobacterales bacterium]|nr:serine/threonine protein kinase [Solirubrobacterales bacterium]